MAKKTNPNVKKFHAETSQKFKADKTGRLIHEDLCVDFDEEGVTWKFSTDCGVSWHTGKFPSGLNLIRQELNKKEGTEK